MSSSRRVSDLGALAEVAQDPFDQVRSRRPQAAVGMNEAYVVGPDFRDYCRETFGDRLRLLYIVLLKR